MATGQVHWSPETSDLDQYTKIDMAAAHVINSVAVTCPGVDDGFGFVRQYYVTYSVDDVTWEYLRERANST